LLSAGVLSAATFAAPASARPTAPPIVCAAAPDAAQCAGQLATCGICHTSTWPAAWNDYGSDVFAGLAGGDFEDGLAAVITQLAAEDSDGDGVDNATELAMGTNPGDETEIWPQCAPGAARPDGLPVATEYDFERALHRVSVLYCGVSPSYDAKLAFRGLADDAARYTALHEQLTACLAGPWWRDQGLPRLADWRVRPVSAVGKDSPVGIIIGDYEWDYRLWTWAMSGGRDVRELLLADYHVEANADGSLQKREGLIVSYPGQPLVPDRRAGMITTQWFFAINTMFSPLPRTSAAQAYRAYLGADMARNQGIWPVDGEPVDVDSKGVDEGECASCHSTLDPLSYAFAYYNGIVGLQTGAYVEGRPAALIPGWNDPTTVLFGQPVDGLTGWAEVAANSDAFKRMVALTFFQHAIDREPLPDEEAAFASLWRSLPDRGWSADALIHDLVDTQSFGVR
jgi:hypothetical protein